MKLFLIFVSIFATKSVFADSLKMVVQQDIAVHQLLSEDHPEYGHSLTVRFNEDGTTTTEVNEPSCLLYIYGRGPAFTIPKDTVFLVKQSNIDHPQDTSQALFHKDRGISVMAETGNPNLEFRVNCSDSAATYMGLKDFDLDTINGYTGQFVTVENN